MDYKEAIYLLHPDTTKRAIWEIADKEKALEKIEKACMLACEAMKRVQEQDSNWIPVSERLPETSKMVLVTVHTSEWISDYHSKWVPEEEKIHYEEKYRTSYGYIDDRRIWICLDETNDEIYCEKEFGTDKGKVYDVVVAWRPLPEPYKEGEHA